MYAGPSKQAYDVSASLDPRGRARGVAGTQAAHRASDKHPASEARSLAQGPMEHGPGSSCDRVRDSLLDHLQRSRPGFAVGIANAREIDTHRAASGPPRRESNA